MADKEKLTTQQEHAELTKETREAQAAPDPEQEPADNKIIYSKLTAAGKPLPINPDTGEIVIKDMTDEQRAEFEEACQQIAGIAEKVLPGVKNFWDKILIIINAFASDEMRDILTESIQTLQQTKEMLQELIELKPYIEEHSSKDFDEIINKFTPFEMLAALNDPDSELNSILEAARKAKNAAPLNIETYRADKLNMPIDKSNFISWNDFTATDNQIKLKLDMMSEKDKRDPERSLLDISMLYSLTFDNDPNIKTTKNINHYDRRLIQAIDTLYVNGKDVCLISEIFYNMGGTGRLGNAQENKLNSSLTKQGTARVYINNKSEAAHYDYPEIEYDGNLLNFERIKVTYRGKEREAIKILRRPVIMEFADQRDQITAIPMKVLQSKISKTDKNLRIEDYLLHRIARRKNDINELQEKQKSRYTQNRQKQINEKRKLTILLPTFYEQTGNADKKSTVQKRALNTACKFLEHYKSEAAGKYIEDYKVDAERIKITLPIQ